MTGLKLLDWEVVRSDSDLFLSLRADLGFKVICGKVVLKNAIASMTGMSAPGLRLM